MPDKGVTLFYSYSHADDDLRVQLTKHLKIFERQGILQGWSDRDISAGSEWRGQIDLHLKNADIVLLLISPDFISSDYCYDVELALALRRHNAGDCVVVPVFLRAVDFSGAPFAELQGLPEGARPVTSWSNRDEALANIARGLRAIVLGLSGSQSTSTSKKEALESGSTSARARDVERITKYWNLFDRPAFTFPCIFEYSLESVSEACDQIMSGMLTGKVHIKRYLSGPVARELPPKDSFETDPFLSVLTQVRNYISNLKRTVSYLRTHLSHPDGKSPANSVESAAHIDHMEFFLVRLVRSGAASQQFVREAFAIMDKVDSERNAIIELMNSLFRIADLRELPYITLSSQQLELSEDMRRYDWDNFFVRTHDFFRRFLESGERDGSTP